ncbi:hypothetical protein N9V86_03180 [Opitutales bacterium]|nr:hypothetical protein [Opitutales bacterium]
MNRALSFSTIALLGRANLKHAREEEYVEWATHMLEEGHETPSLCILAGLEPLLNHFEIQDYFKRSLRELGIERKQKEEEIRIYATETVRHILDESIDYKTGVSLLSSVCISCDYPSYLMDWYSLDDAISDIESGNYPNGYPSAYGRNPKAVVLEIATDFLAKHKNTESNKTR